MMITMEYRWHSTLSARIENEGSRVQISVDSINFSASFYTHTLTHVYI